MIVVEPDTIIKFWAMPGLQGKWLRFKAKAKSRLFKCEEGNILSLLDIIHQCVTYMKDNKLESHIMFHCIIYDCVRNLKKDGVELPLPYGWYLNTPTIEFKFLNEIINTVGYACVGPDLDTTAYLQGKELEKPIKEEST